MFGEINLFGSPCIIGGPEGQLQKMFWEKCFPGIWLCIKEISVRGENILENTVCGVNKVSSEARRDSGKNCSGENVYQVFDYVFKKY